MNQIEQGKLFIAAQRRYKDWSIRQVSGYIHGVVDGLNRDEPQEIYTQRIMRFSKPEPYAVGYLMGFIDAQGSDLGLTPWNAPGSTSWDAPSNFAAKKIEYRWWEKSGISS